MFGGSLLEGYSLLLLGASLVGAPLLVVGSLLGESSNGGSPLLGESSLEEFASLLTEGWLSVGGTIDAESVLEGSVTMDKMLPLS